MKTKHVLILVIFLIASVFFLGRLSTKITRNNQEAIITSLADTLMAYQVDIAGVNRTVFEKNQIIATQEQAIRAGILERDRLKALNMRKVSQITRLNAVLAVYKDSLDMASVEFVTDTIFLASGDVENNTYIKIPFDWKYKDNYVSLFTGVDENRLGHFSLEASVPLVVTLGDKKSGQPTIAITTPSPYIQITDIQMVNIQEVKWYNHWSLPVSGGAIAGVGLGYLLWGR